MGIFQIESIPVDGQIQASNSGQRCHVTINTGLTSDQVSKYYHDLHGAITALKMNIENQFDAIQNPTPRDQKKFDQLRQHLDRLSDAKNVLDQIRFALQPPSHQGQK
jgi:ribosomal protein L21E